MENRSLWSTSDHELSGQLALAVDGPGTTREFAEHIPDFGTRVTTEQQLMPDGKQAGEGALSILGPAQDLGDMGQLGNYRVLKILGQGGMGIVFLACDPTLDRLVALKTMLPSFATDAAARQRFQREAKAAAAIKHDHIVTIYQVGEDRGVPYLAMEFLEGESLDDRLKHENRLPVADVLRIGREIAAGLTGAHERGLVHRDIKPANIWLEYRSQRQGSPEAAARVKILDFGLSRAVTESAKLTQPGTLVGTPEYMSPEQARGEEPKGYSDFFSLRVVLYRMATGRLPFHGDTVLAVLTALATESPAHVSTLNPELPHDLAELIMALLSKNPKGRPSGADVASILGSLDHRTPPKAAGIDQARTMVANQAVPSSDLLKPDADATLFADRHGHEKVVVGKCIEIWFHQSLESSAPLDALGITPGQLIFVQPRKKDFGYAIERCGGLRQFKPPNNKKLGISRLPHLSIDDDNYTVEFFETDWNTLRTVQERVEFNPNLRHELSHIDPDKSHLPQSMALEFIVRFADGSVLAMKRKDDGPLVPGTWSFSAEEQIYQNDFLNTDVGVGEFLFRRAFIEEVFGRRPSEPSEVNRIWTEDCAPRLSSHRFWSFFLAEQVGVFHLFGVFNLKIKPADLRAIHHATAAAGASRDDEGRLYWVREPDFVKLLTTGRCEGHRLHGDSERQAISEEGLHPSSRYRLWRLFLAVARSRQITAPKEPEETLDVAAAVDLSGQASTNAPVLAVSHFVRLEHGAWKILTPEEPVKHRDTTFPALDGWGYLQKILMKNDSIHADHLLGVRQSQCANPESQSEHYAESDEKKMGAPRSRRQLARIVSGLRKHVNKLAGALTEPDLLSSERTAMEKAMEEENEKLRNAEDDLNQMPERKDNNARKVQAAIDRALKVLKKTMPNLAKELAHCREYRNYGFFQYKPTNPPRQWIFE